MQRRNNAFHPNAMRTLETLAPKRFVYKPKRIKKPSTLKKRILLERLKRQLIMQLKQQKIEELQTDILQDESMKVVHLYRLTDDINLNDEDELHEIVDNIKEILSPFAPIRKLSLFDSSNVAAPAQRDMNFVSSFVEVEFYRRSSADNAIKMLNGLVIAGTSIVAIRPTNDTLVPRDHHTVTSTTVTDINIEPINASTQSSIDRILVLRNLLTVNDVEDEDTLSEILNDMQTLCGPFNYGLTSIWIEHAFSSLSTHRMPYMDIDDADTLRDGDFQYPLTLLELEDSGIACDVSELLQGTIVGGNILQVGIGTFKLDYAKHWQCPVISSQELIHGKEGYRCAILIHDFVTYEQVENDEERKEILDDLKVIFTSNVNRDVSLDKVLFVLSPDAATVSTSSVHILLTVCKNESSSTDASIVATSDTPSLSNAGKKDKTKAKVNPPLPEVVSSFKDIADISKQLSRTVVGGDCLRTSILYINEDFVSSSNVDADDIALMSYEDFNAVSLAVSTVDGRCVVAVSQFVTSDDIAEEVVTFNDPETIVACKRDFLQLLEAKGMFNSSQAFGALNKIMICAPPSASTKVPNIPEKSTSAEYIVCLRFNSCDYASAGKSISDALTFFDGLIISGVAIDAEIESSKVHDATKSLISAENLGTKTASSSASIQPNGLIISRELCSRVFEEEFPLPSEGECTALIDESAIVIPQGRYQVAKQAPKLQIHRNPDKAIPVASDELNVIIKEFLKLISTFQQRLKEKNPTKVKQKLRFVAGIKQSLSGVKSKKARIIFLAPNTEVSEELDTRLDALVNEAKQREIPVVYCLSKRLLGKAVQMTIKQSVITVFDPDGAYDLFKKIIRFVVPPS